MRKNIINLFVVLFTAFFSGEVYFSSGILLSSENIQAYPFASLSIMPMGNSGLLARGCVRNPEKQTLVRNNEIYTIRSVIKYFISFHPKNDITSYSDHNDLVFNRPLIQFKFPLSEHTEEG